MKHQIAIATMVFALGCGDDDNSVEQPQRPGEIFAAQLEGESFKASATTATLWPERMEFIISGRRGSAGTLEENIQCNFPSTASPGDYPLTQEAGRAYGCLYSVKSQSRDELWSAQEGELSLEVVDREQKLIKGSFRFVTKDTSSDPFDQENAPSKPGGYSVEQGSFELVYREAKL